MLLDRALATTFRHFATCFLLVAMLTVPLHVAVSYSHRDVIALVEIHDDIAEFRDRQRVRGVGTDELNAYRSSGPIIILVELAALPILVAAAVRIVEQDAAGRPSFIVDAWKHGARRWRHLRPARPGVALAGAILAVMVGLLARTAGHLAAEPLPDAVAWAGAALAEGLSRALGAPFLLIPAAFAFGPAKGGPPGAPTR